MEVLLVKCLNETQKFDADIRLLAHNNTQKQDINFIHAIPNNKNI